MAGLGTPDAERIDRADAVADIAAALTTGDRYVIGVFPRLTQGIFRAFASIDATAYRDTDGVDTIPLLRTARSELTRASQQSPAVILVPKTVSAAELAAALRTTPPDGGFPDVLMVWSPRQTEDQGWPNLLFDALIQLDLDAAMSDDPVQAWLSRSARRSPRPW